MRPRPGRGQLARHRGPQQRTDDPALRAHDDCADAAAARVVSFEDIASALPADTKRLTADERAAILERRRRAVHGRFAR